MSDSSEAENNMKKFFAIGIILLVAWVGLHFYAQSQLDTYNNCQGDVFNRTDSVQNDLVNDYGLSRGEAADATFDSYGDQLDVCAKYKPADMVLLISGAQAR